MVTVSVFFAQIYDGGGAGAWPIGVSGVITVFVAFIAYHKTATIYADKADCFFLLLAISSLPVWFLTSDPLGAVIILTVAEVLGFLPTVRKAYARPFEESLLFFSIFATRNMLSIVALENYTLTTLLFPVITTLACVLLIVVVLNRRLMLSGHTE